MASSDPGDLQLMIPCSLSDEVQILIKIFASSLKKHNKKKTNETIKNTNLEVNTVQMQNCFKTARFNDQVNAQRLQIMYDWPKNTSHIQRQREKN